MNFYYTKSRVDYEPTTRVLRDNICPLNSRLLTLNFLLSTKNLGFFLHMCKKISNFAADCVTIL